MTKLHLITYERVQGGGYRDWLINTALLHKLRGWVQNITDSIIEAVLAGSEASLVACLAERPGGTAYGPRLLNRDPSLRKGSSAWL